LIASAASSKGQIEFVTLDFDDGEERLQEDTSDSLTAEKIFDARWAMTLLAEAGKRLREEYVSQGKTRIIDTLQPFLDPASSQQLASYQAVAEKLKVSLGGVKTLIHRLRKRSHELLREEVARTLTDSHTVDEEIHSLCEALLAVEGQLGP
jgi:hypothetical protein